MKPPVRIPWLFLMTCLVTALLPFIIGNAYTRSILVMAGIYALAALGLQLLLAHAGMVSLGQNGFLALGAYGSALMSLHLGHTSWLPLLISGATAAAIAYLIGRLLGRLEGHFFAVATLGIGIVTYTVAAEFVRLTGGNNGLGAYHPPQWQHEKNDYVYYGIVWILVLAVGRFITFFLGTNAGRCLQLASTHEASALLCGVDVLATRARVFAFAAALTTIAGGLLAYYVGYLTPSLFNFESGINLLCIAVIGGRRPVGAVISAVVLTALPMFAARLVDYQLLITGTLLILALIMPRSGIFKRVNRNWEDGR